MDEPGQRGEDGETVLERLIANHRRESDAQIAKMRAEGRTPAPQDNIIGTSCLLFDFSLRWMAPWSTTAAIRICAYDPETDSRDWIWGAPWPEAAANIEAEPLLLALSRKWETLGQGWLASPIPGDTKQQHGKVEISWPLLAAPPLVFDVDGKSIQLRIPGEGGRIAYGSESVVVLEALGALGNVLAERLARTGASPGTVSMWRMRRGKVRVLPAPAGSFDDPDSLVAPSREEEVRFWCDAIGQEPDLFRRSAIWLLARQWLFATAQDEPEPAANEWDVRKIPSGLPSEQEVRAMAARATELASSRGGRLDIEEEAITQRCMDARAYVYFGRARETRSETGLAPLTDPAP